MKIELLKQGIAIEEQMIKLDEFIKTLKGANNWMIALDDNHSSYLDIDSEDSDLKDLVIKSLSDKLTELEIKFEAL